MGLTVENAVGVTEDTDIQEPALPKRGTPFRSYDFSKDFYNRQQARYREAKIRTNKASVETATSHEKKKKRRWQI